MRKTLFLAVCLFISFIMLSSAVYPAQDSFEELEYGDGQKLFVLLPSEYNPDQQYPSVYFMPMDGFAPQQYLDDGIDLKIRELEHNGGLPAMIYVFPQFHTDEDVFGQIQEAVKTVQEHYPAMDDSSLRGAVGSGVGGYLALLMTYTTGDKQVEERPLLFAAAASHDGDFTSSQNPFPEKYGDLYTIFQETGLPYGQRVQWISNYHAYLDCNSDSSTTWEKGGTADIASLFRTVGLIDQENPLAWDYSVFEYSIRPSENYGKYLNNIGRSLKSMADTFGLMEMTSPDKTTTEIDVQETIIYGDERPDGRLVFSYGICPGKG